MSLRFPYLPFTTHRPIVPLAGALVRPRPIINVTLIGPAGILPQDALLDTGADDTVFPERIAAQIGVDLTGAPTGSAVGMGTGSALVRYAEVTLRIADYYERREWRAWIGFTAVQFRHPMLGFAGFLQYFTATFHGDRAEVELTVNSRYAGK
jgi:hypothetical protein